MAVSCPRSRPFYHNHVAFINFNSHMPDYYEADIMHVVELINNHFSVDGHMSSNYQLIVAYLLHYPYFHTYPAFPFHSSTILWSTVRHSRRLIHPLFVLLLLVLVLTTLWFKRLNSTMRFWRMTHIESHRMARKPHSTPTIRIGTVYESVQTY